MTDGKKTLTVLVCGGRDYGDIKQPDPVRLEQYFQVMKTLDDLAASSWPRRPDGGLDVRIVSGAARGVDSVAIDWAKVNMVECLQFPADWEKHGKSAGAIRNKQMLDEGKPDLVVAFPGGRGTANMAKQARMRKIEMLHITTTGASSREVYL